MNISRKADSRPFKAQYNSKSSTPKPKTILYRKYSAKGAVCYESAINNVVARVQLERFDFSDYTVNEHEHPDEYVRPMGNYKPQKRKLSQVEGNRKKIRMINRVGEKATKLRVGTNSMKMRMKHIRTHLNAKRRRHFNGDKRQIIISSPRVRKPNPKFQDFITTSIVRQSAATLDRPIKEKSDSPSIKPRLVKSTTKIPEKDPLELMYINNTDGDVVRSFLPVIDTPKVLYDSDSEPDIYDGLSNSEAVEKSPRAANTVTLRKAQTIRPLPPKGMKSIQPKSKNSKSPQLMPPAQLATNASIILAPNTVTPILIPQLVNSNQVPIIFTTNLISSPAPVKKASLEVDLSANNGVVKRPLKPLKTYSEKKSIKQSTVLDQSKKLAKESVKLSNLEKRNEKKNLSNEVLKKKEVSRYYLVESEGASNRTKMYKGSIVDFSKLVRALKSVKLPAANWKIRIVVSRTQTITEVTFTNKEVNERCVKFSRSFTGYIITFGKSVVKLIGAPNKISSYNDVTTLLDIVHNLSLNDPVLEYVEDKNK